MSKSARAIAIAGLLTLCGCIYAASSVMPGDKSLKLFGDSGRYTMKDFAKAGKQPRVESGNFTWNGSSYLLMPPTKANASTVKLAVLNEEWFVTEEVEPDHMPHYTLAKVKGKTVSIYNSDCANLSDVEVGELGLTKDDKEPGCKASSWEQVTTTLLRIAGRKPNLMRTYTIN
ncbi:MAG: hypothetical protein ABL973_07810 [Micropepsaceae bacterium]